MFDFTTASQDSIRKVYNRIAKQIGDDRFFTTKELAVLPKILVQYEQVLSFSSGIMDGNTWLIVLTDQRVLFLDKGLFFGVNQTSIELENIVSINGETGIFFGDIRISTAAKNHEIRNVSKRTVNPFINSVRGAITARKKGEQLYSPAEDDNTQSEPQDRSRAGVQDLSRDVESENAEALNRLERLRLAGSISQQEYDEKIKSLRTS